MKFRPVLSVTAVAIVFLVAACKQSLADLPARDHSRDGAVTPVSLTPADETPKVDPRTLPVAKVAGKPMWAANKSHTAEENAQYQFEHHAGDFGVTTVAAYVDRAHSFTARPPAGAERVTRGSNGDILIYDPASNIFAVVSKDGGPRTFFKPDNGPSYWAQQKQDLAAQDKGGAPRSASTRSGKAKASQG